MTDNLGKVSGLFANATEQLRQANEVAGPVASILILQIIRKTCELKAELENLRTAMKLDGETIVEWRV